MHHPVRVSAAGPIGIPQSILRLPQQRDTLMPLFIFVFHLLRLRLSTQTHLPTLQRALLQIIPAVSVCCRRYSRISALLLRFSHQIRCIQHLQFEALLLAHRPDVGAQPVYAPQFIANQSFTGSWTLAARPCSARRCPSCISSLVLFSPFPSTLITRLIECFRSKLDTVFVPSTDIIPAGSVRFYLHACPHQSFAWERTTRKVIASRRTLESMPLLTVSGLPVPTCMRMFVIVSGLAMKDGACTLGHAEGFAK